MISDCTCDGINILKDLTNLYIENATTYIEKRSENKLYRKKVKNVADRLYNQLTYKETGEIQGVTDLVRKNFRLNEHRRACEEGNTSDCLLELDSMLALMHQSPDSQSKLICANREKFRNRDLSERELSEYRNIATLEQTVDDILTDLLRGTFINKEEGKLVFNPFEEHVDDNIEQCSDKYRYKIG